VIYRSYYLRQTTTQIAAEFSTDDELVKHDLHRALHTLRATLQKRDDMTRRRLRVV
jgi:DNA-directed RNA polymerase specialized sigma24 family protein